MCSDIGIGVSGRARKLGVLATAGAKGARTPPRNRGLIREDVGCRERFLGPDLFPAPVTRRLCLLALLSLALCSALPVAAQSANRTVYWIGPETDTHDAIYTYDLDTGRVATLVRASTLGPDDRRKIIRLAVDATNGWLYWIDSGGTDPAGVLNFGSILRVRFDGTGVQTFVRATVCGIGIPTDIALDPTGRTLYWSRESDCLVQRREV